MNASSVLAASGARRDRWIGIALTLVSAVAFGGLSIFNRFAGAAGVNVITLLSLRFTLAALMLWLLAVRHRTFRISRQRFAGLGLLGGLYVAQATSYLVSSRRIPVALTGILLYLYPVFVTALAWLFLHDRLTRQRLLSLGLALAGLALTLGAPGLSGDGYGIFMALLSGGIYAVYIVLGSQLQQNIPAIIASAYIITAAAVVATLIALSTGQLQTDLSGPAYIPIAGMALVCTVLPVTAFLAGMERIGASQAAIVSAVEPVSTAVMGALLLGEGVGILQALGGALVLGAVVLLSLRKG